MNSINVTLIRDKDQRIDRNEETQLRFGLNVHAVDDYVHADWTRWQTTIDPNQSLSLLLPEYETIDADPDRRGRGSARRRGSS